MNTKQVIIIRKDLNMRRGKEIAQGCHASLAFLTRRIEITDILNNFDLPPFVTRPCTFEGILSQHELEWLRSSYRKIVLCVDSEAELLALDEAAKNAKLESHLVPFYGKITITNEKDK